MIGIYDWNLRLIYDKEYTSGKSSSGKVSSGKSSSAKSSSGNDSIEKLNSLFSFCLMVYLPIQPDQYPQKLFRMEIS